MARVIRRGALAAVSIGLLTLLGTARSTPLPPDQLPEPVANTFKAMFPNGTIVKLDVAEEEGVMVYDFEFRAGDREKETDIVADGTMIESTLVIPRAQIPATALKGMQGFAKGATFGRCEWIETFYEIKAGKIIKMDKSMIKYAAELTRKGKQSEVIVSTDGKVLEAPEWVPITPPQAPPVKSGK